MMDAATIARSLTGLRGILRWDPRAFTLFDATLEGFWTSMRLAFVIAPVYGLEMLDGYLHGSEPVADGLRYFLVAGIGYTVSWFLWPLVMVSVSGALERRHRLFRYLVAYNWFQLVWAAVFLPFSLLSLAGVESSEAQAFIMLMLYAAGLFFDWFVARHGLDIGGGAAAGVVFLDVVVSLIVGQVGNHILT